MTTRAKTGGRKAGTPNRRSAAFKESLLVAYHRIGGDRALTKWARENKTDFFRIMAKLLPSQMLLNASLETTPPPIYTDFQIAQRIAFSLEKARRQQVEVVQEEPPEAPEGTQPPPVALPPPITYPVPFNLPDAPVPPPPVTMATPIKENDRQPEEAETLESYHARMLTENTTILSIETYPGSRSEQAKDRPTDHTEPSLHPRVKRRPLL